MDSELKQALEALEGRIAARFDQVHNRFEQVSHRFDQVDKRFEEVFERINDTETKLLNAFYGWAKPVEARLKVLPSIDERLGFMEN